MSLREIFSPSLEEEVRQAFRRLAKEDGGEVSKRCGVVFLPPRPPQRKHGRYIVNLLTKTYSVELGSMEVVDLISGKPASRELALIIVRYLGFSTSGRHSDDWVSYEKFPGARPYLQLFDRSVLRPLARIFGYNPERYEVACRRLGGKRERLGGMSYSFIFLPKIKVLTQVWRARKEDYTPPAANMSFNKSSRHYLSVRDLLLVGQYMVKILESESKKA